MSKWPSGDRLALLGQAHQGRPQAKKNSTGFFGPRCVQLDTEVFLRVLAGARLATPSEVNGCAPGAAVRLAGRVLMRWTCHGALLALRVHLGQLRGPDPGSPTCSRIFFRFCWREAE